MGNDSADGQCLLQRANERHQFSGGSPAAAAFDPKIDDAPNYGNTGQTIGHELTHGFDDEGRHFDAKGNLKDWWTEDDASAFTRKAQCIVDQYSQYTVIDDIKINGKLTLARTWRTWAAR